MLLEVFAQTLRDHNVRKHLLQLRSVLITALRLNKEQFQIDLYQYVTQYKVKTRS